MAERKTVIRLTDAQLRGARILLYLGGAQLAAAVRDEPMMPREKLLAIDGRIGPEVPGELFRIFGMVDVVEVEGSAD